MKEELSSSYIHKYDVLRTLALELVHFAMKTQPSSQLTQVEMSAAQRISTLFMELLERQFPIDPDHQRVQCRTASEFAKQLNIHVNHLNRAVKETRDKTTSQLISERLLREAKVMLRHSPLNISEIAYALGFNEATHFSNFFKKNTQSSPSQFRKVQSWFDSSLIHNIQTDVIWFLYLLVWFLLLESGWSQ